MPDIITPPNGDPVQAEKYVNQLISLIETDKLDVSYTDLAKFDPSALQDHYRLGLKEYSVEISHSKHPSSGKDSYVILFTNIKNFIDGNCEKIILAYMHLSDDQFKSFKSTADEQLERKRKEAAEKRLNEAMTPIDQALEKLVAPNPHPTNITTSQDTADNSIAKPLDNNTPAPKTSFS